MKKTLPLVLAMAFSCAIAAFADNVDLAKLQDHVDGFSGKLAEALPFNASMGLNWSDAYIGQLLSLPPHFGVGVSGGFTSLTSSEFTDLLKDFGLSLPIDKMLLPGYTVEGRIGGFILPFDIGVKFGILPEVNFGDTIKLDYLLAGADVRFALLKGNLILPKVSLGFGVNYLRGGVSAPIGTGASFTFNDGLGHDDQSDHTLSLSKPDASFSWQTTSFELKAQVSKTILIVTPYLGAGVNYSISKAGYSVDSELKYDNVALDSTSGAQEIKDYLKEKGATGLYSLDGKGFSSILENEGFGGRLFGGVSFKLAIINLDVTGLYNFVDQNYGLTVGVRAQL